MALDLLSTKALAGELEPDEGHEAEVYFAGFYDTACYDNGHTIDSAVPARTTRPGKTRLLLDSSCH